MSRDLGRLYSQYGMLIGYETFCAGKKQFYNFDDCIKIIQKRRRIPKFKNQKFFAVFCPFCSNFHMKAYLPKDELQYRILRLKSGEPF